MRLFFSSKVRLRRWMGSLRLIKRPMFVPKTCWTSNGLSAFLDLVWMHISWTFLLHGINLVYPLFPGTKGLGKGRPLETHS